MEKVITSFTTKHGNVIFAAKSFKPIYGGLYSIWVGTECMEVGLCLDAAKDMYEQIKKEYE